MAAEITGSGDSGSASYATTVTWINSGSGPSGQTFSLTDNASGYDTVQITHNLNSTSVIVDIVELSVPSGQSYYNQQNAGLDIGHTNHVIVVRDGANTVKLIFYNSNPTDSTYKILVQKVG